MIYSVGMNSYQPGHMAGPKSRLLANNVGEPKNGSSTAVFRMTDVDVTDADGIATVNFAYAPSTKKTNVLLTVESAIDAQARITRFIRNTDGDYIGFEIMATEAGSHRPAESVTVHYSVRLQR